VHLLWFELTDFPARRNIFDRRKAKKFSYHHILSTHFLKLSKSHSFRFGELYPVWLFTFSSPTSVYLYVRLLSTAMNACSKSAGRCLHALVSQRFSNAVAVLNRFILLWTNMTFCRMFHFPTIANTLHFSALSMKGYLLGHRTVFPLSKFYTEQMFVTCLSKCLL